MRPTLVLDVENRAGHLFAILAYGTSNPRKLRDTFIVDVSTDAELRTASSRKRTRFQASRRIAVALTNPWFDVSVAKQTPVLGCLTGTALERLHSLRARIHAERDIRRSRLFGRRPHSTSSRPVTVDYTTQPNFPIGEAPHV